MFLVWSTFYHCCWKYWLSAEQLLFTDEDKPSIVDAIGRMSSKQSSPKKVATKTEEVKHDISPADFFGLTPVHVGKDSKVFHSMYLSLFC